MIPDELAAGPAIPFHSWPSTPVPKGPPGVYTIWNGNSFVYVGISWRELDVTAKGATLGLWGRLNSHASGRRSGDQFCIYICDRFVLGALDGETIRDIAAGTQSLDRLTRDYIRAKLSYRFVTTSTGAEARQIEASIRKDGLRGHGPPLLNPLAEKQVT